MDGLELRQSNLELKTQEIGYAIYNLSQVNFIISRVIPMQCSVYRPIPSESDRFHKS